MTIRKGENPIKIVRYSKMIAFRDGMKTNMHCMKGSMEEVTEMAQKVARENDCEIEAIV